MVTPSTEPISTGLDPQAGSIAEPFVHRNDNSFYNPLTDRHLNSGDPGFHELRNLIKGKIRVADLSESIQTDLQAGGWIVEATGRLANRFRLKYVSLETHTLCNQRCYFCPVSVRPRQTQFMPTTLFEKVVQQLGAYEETLEGVSLTHYNEPTLDRRFADQLRLLHRHHLKVALLTNGARLNSELVDTIRGIARLHHLGINLPTFDKDRFRSQCGAGHLSRIRRNLDYLVAHPIAEHMEIVVLGTGDVAHQQDMACIESYFQGSPFRVKYYEVMNRAGHVRVGDKPNRPLHKLCGCNQTGSRALQWVHITASGECVLCCQDYAGTYKVGNLQTHSLSQILKGQPMAGLRAWVYGLKTAPSAFLCRHCIFALTQ